ncbi:MAG: TonB-dependent receptor [Calditrichaeota bacterium]|nr:TonB-dependent receptor [Calditrichota bacterium]
MRQIRIFIFGIFVVLAMTNLLLGQTRSASDSLKKQQKKSARLQLPDEIIYGQNKSRRIVKKNKKTFSSEISLLPAKVASLSPVIEFAANKSVFSRSENTKDARKSLLLHWGRFQDANFAGTWSQQTRLVNFRAAGQFRRIGGQFENSQFQRTVIAADVSRSVTENLSAALSLDGNVRDYGLFQARQSNAATRDVQQLQTDFFVNYLNEKGHALNGRIFYRGNHFEDADSAKVSQKDRWFGFNFDYSKKINATLLSVSSDYQHNSFGENQQQSIFEGKLGIGFAPLHFLRVKVSAFYQDVEVSELQSRTKFSPELELIFTPLENFGGKIFAKREIAPIAFDRWFQANPYLDFSANLQPMEKDLQLGASFEYLPAENLDLRADLKIEKTKNDVYWTQSPQTGLFGLNRLESTTVTKFSLAAAWDLAPNIRLDGKFMATFYSIGDDSLRAADAHLPYTENFSLPLSLEWQFARSWRFDLGMNWVGSRFTAVQRNEKLPSFLWLSAKLEKRIFSQYRLFLQGTNLLNQAVEIWQNFPERGVSLLAGVRAEW